MYKLIFAEISIPNFRYGIQNTIQGKLTKPDVGKVIHPVAEWFGGGSGL